MVVVLLLSLAIRVAAIHWLPLTADFGDVFVFAVFRAGADLQENNENVFVVLDLAPPSAKRIRDLDVSAIIQRLCVTS